MRFADGTVVRVRQPERLDPVSITPGLSIPSRRELLERATAARAPAEVALCPETGPDRLCHEQAEEQQGANFTETTRVAGQLQ
jgi:hypothetical protein